MHYRSMSMRFRAGGIEITGVNGAFVFRHALYVSVSNYTTYTTYTINLDPGVYTTDELVTALNAAIETQGVSRTCQGISLASGGFHNYNFHRLH